VAILAEGGSGKSVTIKNVVLSLLLFYTVCGRIAALDQLYYFIEETLTCEGYCDTLYVQERYQLMFTVVSGLQQGEGRAKCTMRCGWGVGGEAGRSLKTAGFITLSRQEFSLIILPGKFPLTAGLQQRHITFSSGTGSGIILFVILPVICLL
jgi:hypothetical protein